MTDNQKGSTTTQTKATSTIAKSDDGTIQITYTIPYAQIDENRHKVAQELGADIEVPGFRKGKAPVDKVIQQIPQNTLLEKTLSNILPQLFSESIKEHKINPTIYPKFEVISANESEDWQVRAVTCELPEIDLTDYKKKILAETKTNAIWTPDKLKEEGEKQELTQSQKEQEILKGIIKTIEIKIPKILVDDEVNSRLSQLLERLEKLGLNLDSYLASIGKTAQTLRQEYEQQAEEAIKIDLALIKIAEKENITIAPDDIEKAIQASAGDEKLAEKLNTPQQKNIIENILKRRKALDTLVSQI